MSTTPERKKIAVIGAGVAGLTAGWLLQRKYEVTVFERNDYLGGHTRTLWIPEGADRGTPVDTGFIVMNHRNYPLFTRVLEQLGVELGDSCMSFGFHDKVSGYAYAGTGVLGMFAQPKNLFSKAHWALIREIIRFGKTGPEDLESGVCGPLTLGEYLQLRNFGPEFCDRYLLPIGAAIWSSPPEAMRAFPAESYLHFLANHGLLTLKNRPQWRYVKGGSQTYVKKMRETFQQSPMLNCAPRGVRRTPDGVEVILPSGEVRVFDQVVIATHGDEALKLLEDPTAHEQRQLGAWQYQANEVVLHTCPEVMPPTRRAWASWNFEREPGFEGSFPVNVTYHMNRLQNLKTDQDYFVTLNRQTPIPEARVVNRTVLHHPLYTFDALTSQDLLRENNGENRTWFCGSYLGYGFHEDAVRSAVEVAESLGARL